MKVDKETLKGMIEKFEQEERVIQGCIQALKMEIWTRDVKKITLNSKQKNNNLEGDKKIKI